MLARANQGFGSGEHLHTGISYCLLSPSFNLQCEAPSQSVSKNVKITTQFALEFCLKPMDCQLKILAKYFTVNCRCNEFFSYWIYIHT